MPARRSDAARRRGASCGPGAWRTRERLLDAGATVFAERGVHAARVDDIVKVAATSHGTFYLYFANKEELFHALAEQVAGELEALAGRLPAARRPTPAGVDALDAWLRRVRRRSTPRTGPVIRAWTETEMVATAMGRLGTVVLGHVHERARRADPGHRRRRLDPVIAALALVAMIERANYYVLTGQVPAPDGTLPATLRARHPRRDLRPRADRDRWGRPTPGDPTRSVALAKVISPVATCVGDTVSSLTEIRHLVAPSHTMLFAPNGPFFATNWNVTVPDESGIAVFVPPRSQSPAPVWSPLSAHSLAPMFCAPGV